MVTSALVQETVNWRENRQSAPDAESEAEAEADDDSDSSNLSLNRALDEDASIIANFQSIDITTLPPKLRERVQNFLAERECEDFKQLDSDHEELEFELKKNRSLRNRSLRNRSLRNWSLKNWIINKWK